MRKIVLLLVLSLFSQQAHSQDFGNFKANPMDQGRNLAFFEKDRNQSGSYSLSKSDPFGSNSSRHVHEFRIVPGECGNPSDRGDCSDDPSNRSLQSIRSELSENNHRGTRYGRIQPPQAWYEWEVGFPKGFPFGPRQSSGYYLFGQWHNSKCPHMNLGNWVNEDDYQLHLRINKISPGHKFGDCQPLTSLPVIDLREIEGRWASIRVFVKWSTEADGVAEVYVDDVLRVTYTGPTLIKGLADRNHFDFGIYLAGTRDINSIKPATLYYRNVKRSLK